MDFRNIFLRKPQDLSKSIQLFSANYDVIKHGNQRRDGILGNYLMQLTFLNYNCDLKPAVFQLH